MLWNILPKKSDDLLEQLLFNRGIKTEKEKQEFFHPKIENFERDLQIPGISKAKKRIEKAMENSELIIAYGDYDVDGIAGAAVLYLGLTSLGAKILPYIPHREKEGYGLSKQGLEFARDSGATLVITCDTGIVAFEMAEYVKELGLDLIITDHHQTLDNKLPDALSIVHSIKLCGTGVAWCLVRAMLSKNKSEELLDFVAVATIADMMPLLGVNRALVKEGLEKLNETERVGFLELFNESGITRGEIGSYEVGHIIAPRLNAMGRLEHAIDSLRLLCTKDREKARKLARLVGETNSERKLLTQTAVEEAKLKINNSSGKNSKKIYVLSSTVWVQGIIGLVAGRICDETGSSAIAISVGEEFSKGSARAASGVNIVEVIRKCSDLVVAVGGHKGAAGFTIETTKISEFQKRIESLMEVEEELPRSLKIEAELENSKLTLNLAKKIAEFEPFGIENQKPVLATKKMKLSDLRTVGSGKHMKGKADEVDFIGFSMGEMARVLENGQYADLAYIIDIDKFDGTEKLQLKVKDLKL